MNLLLAFLTISISKTQPWQSGQHFEMSRAPIVANEGFMDSPRSHLPSKEGGGSLPVVLVIQTDISLAALVVAAGFNLADKVS